MRSFQIAGQLVIMASMIACSPSTAGFNSGTDGSSGGEDTNRPNDTNDAEPDPDTSAGSASAGEDETTSWPDPRTSTWAAASTTGTGSGSNDCSVAHPEPGCDDPAVETCVCDEQPNCCVFEWDESCVSMAQVECADVGTGGSTGSRGDTGSTSGAGACGEVVTFEMLPSEATLTGAWELGMSMVGEGEIAVLNQMLGTGGSILFEPDIPCDDTWTIWVRYWEQGSDDSYAVTLDDMPMPEAVFEGDCSGAGQGYAWAALNWRDQADPPCVYLEDPWTPTWQAGTHAIEFSYRESLAMGRILITNDPALVP